MATIFRGLPSKFSHTPKHGIKHFNVLVLTEAVLHIKPKVDIPELLTTSFRKLQNSFLSGTL